MFDGVDNSVVPFFVGREAFPAFVERVAPHLARMADGSDGRYAADDIREAIASGRFQLWLALEGADILCVMVTEIITYPRLRALRCIGVVGHRPRRWMDLMENVEHAAKTVFGCRKMEALCQPGHERLLQTGGWQIFHYLCAKDL